MFLIVSKYLIPKGYRGLTIFPFVFIKHRIDSKDKVMMNHEKIHIRQQLELLIFPFYVLYLGHFFINLIKYKSRNVAYRKIVFEKEAYANEADFGYLKRRKFLGFLRYF